ncbi:hypothetical protein WAB17_00910 [Parerythrobacter aurantius]|uniref:hypothetical protein n=1 Tax=Parerythrobacter aurantius TaxID=3127706 RepID=UPI003246C934
MQIAKQVPAILISLAFASCNATEGAKLPEEPSFELTYADAPIAPLPENVRFFERPKMFAEMRKGEGPFPEIVLLEHDPWAEVLGSDSPRFALYSDGQVIYRTEGGFHSVRLTEAEARSIKKSLLAANSPTLSGQYQVVEATDQPDSNLLIYGNPSVFLSVYGSLDDDQVISRLPVSVAKAFDTVRTFESARSEPWMPAQIEVMLWPYEYAPEASIQWKEEWPDLSAPSTVKRGESYSLFLPSSELAALKSFLAGRRPKGAIEINGRKWSASYRIPFPKERLWMAPNPEASSGSDKK